MNAYAIGAAGAILVATAAPGTRPARDDLPVSLEQIKEIRRLDIVDRDDDFDVFNKPGLELRFEVDVPLGRSIISFEQPTGVTAVDSKGKDLGRIEPNAFGDREWVTAVTTWDEPTSAFTFRLELPSRSAESFDVTALCSAVTCVGTRQVTLRPTTQWQTIDEPLFGGGEIRCRLGEMHGSASLEFRPGTIKDLVEKAELVVGRDIVASEASMWNDRYASFLFDAAASEGCEARITLRTGMRRMPIRIELDDQLLP